MKQLIRLSLVLTLLVAMVPAFGQTQENAKATAIVKSIHKLDVLNQILPLVMTKDQIKKVLVEIEKVREVNRNIEKQELAELEAVQAKVDKALADSIAKGDLPSEEIMQEMEALLVKFQQRRAIQIGRNVKAMNEALLEHLNEGQIKAAANSVNPKYFDPSINVDELVEGQKLYMWIERVMLDPVTYEVLIELSKA